MKGYVLILFLLPIGLHAQFNKEFQMRFGAGVGAHATLADYRIQFGNDTYVTKDTSGAATRQLNFNGRYAFHRRLAVGFNISRGNYIYDPEDNNIGKSNKFSMIGVGLEFNAVAKENFRWYLGMGLHVSSLKMTEPLLDGVAEAQGTTKWSGAGFLLNTGLIGFIKQGPFGLTFDIGYQTNALKLQDYSIDGESQDTENWEVSLDTYGLMVNAGLIWRFIQ